MNVLVLKGRLTNDPTTVLYGEGRSFIKFGFAVRKEIKKEEGKPDADFFNCTYGGKNAELISRKGQELVISGRIENNEWIDTTSGAKRKEVAVRVDKFSLCGSKPDSAPQDPMDLDDTDIPF